MFDTVALSETHMRGPDLDWLLEASTRIDRDRFTGEPYRYFLSGPQRSKEPRLTLTRSDNGKWLVRAEVSIPNWHLGSSLNLPTDADIPSFLERISSYVRDRTGLAFNASRARVARLDVTEDLRIGEVNVANLLRWASQLHLPKYSRNVIDGTTVQFDSKGKRRYKSYVIYDKSLELQANKHNIPETEMISGIARLEIRHMSNDAVADLAKRLELKNHQAGTILKQGTSRAVIAAAKLKLKIKEIIDPPLSPIAVLIEQYGPGRGRTLIGHLYIEQLLHSGLLLDPDLKGKAATLKTYERQCRAAGVVSL